MSVRTRFAPSPTGAIHIGNVRPAIYNWLFARRHGGQFLLRVEDTDRERSTPEAVQTIFDAMAWLGLSYDEEPLYQSANEDKHRAAADGLLAAGRAYLHRKGEGGDAVLFRIPWDTSGIGEIRTVGTTELRVHPDTPVRIGPAGISFALISKKGKPMPQESCLAGFRDLVIRDASGRDAFEIETNADAIFDNGRTFEVPDAARMSFTRREVCFTDRIKGELSKSLDSMRDFVIVRSDGVPLFHVANVCDDVEQGITHIIRGDDHVENTFRHIFLYRALGHAPPDYAHLPMIVNEQGKPYSKRDGDAYVGDFREHGYLGEALFNYLAVLQWTPEGEREVMTREEMVEAFNLDKVRSSPAQVDLRKLQWMNGEYMAAMPGDEYAALMKDELRKAGLWDGGSDEEYFCRVLAAMGDRIKLQTDIVRLAGFFFTDDYEYDEKAARKRLFREGALGLLSAFRERLESGADFSADSLERLLTGIAEERGARPADLIHATRVAVSGLSVGPGLFEMLGVLGKERVIARIDRTLNRFTAG